MKKYGIIGLGLVAMLALVTLAGCTPPGSGPVGQVSSINLGSQQTGIWVNGTGEVTVVPDIVTVSLGVQARAATVTEAQSQASAAMNKVMDALTSNSVDKKDIQTQHFSIQPVYKFDNTKQEQILTGYEVTNTVTAKIRNIDKAGTIIDAVSVAGGDATRVNSVNLSVDKPSDSYGAARQAAMDDAEAKAKQLANLAGVTLGKPTFIQENTQSPPIIFQTFERVAGIPAPAIAPTPISPGEQKITITVQVVYAIK